MTVLPYLTSPLSADPANPLAWNDLFPPGNHSFNLRGHRAAPAAFFQPQDPSGALTAERAHWLDTAPQHHLWAPSSCGPLARELALKLNQWGVIGAGSFDPHAPPAAVLNALGRRIEPDLLLLQREASQATEGRDNPSHRLAGGCVCFPSSWSLSQKQNLTLDQIHAIVPGLNPDLGRSINRFLARLDADQAWCRINWGISTTAERNQDPWRSLPRLASGLAPASLWLRIEYQALVALPASNGLAFAIRVESISLQNLATHPIARQGLRHALIAMPPALAHYKGIAPILDDVCAWLASH